MTVLRQIYEDIKLKGYINISELMIIALSQYPTSYYRKKNPFSGSGDFITSPEVSQMFGEMIGLWVYHCWEKMGSPSKFNLVELGPGRGLLMRDALRLSKNTLMHKAANVFFVDINSLLIEDQKNNNKDFSDVSFKWIDVNKINQLPKLPTLFIANEFFDALPINQFVKDNVNWKEVIIKIDPQTHKLFYDKVQIRDILEEQLSYDYKNAGDGSIIEESPQSVSIVKQICNVLIENTGAALFIDYGYDINPASRLATQFYSTLQAIKNHKFVSVLEDIGTADISAHVDFNKLKIIAERNKVNVFGAISQREFLLALSIQTRCSQLISMNKNLESILLNQLERLIGENQMGNLFKVLCFSNIKDYSPLGFPSSGDN